MREPAPGEPSLVNALDFAESDIGRCVWDCDHTDLLSLSEDGRTIAWPPRKAASMLRGLRRRILRQPDFYPPAWVPAPTHLHLHSGNYKVEFHVSEMASAQIGLGFMLLWNVGPDWGFYGYLGSSPSAWAYDPSTGDVVCNTKSIQGNLPTFGDARTGSVAVHLSLPRQAAGEATFCVRDVDAQTIPLPEGSVVVPAACLLRESQRVTLASLEKP